MVSDYFYKCNSVDADIGKGFEKWIKITFDCLPNLLPPKKNPSLSLFIYRIVVAEPGFQFVGKIEKKILKTKVF